MATGRKALLKGQCQKVPNGRFRGLRPRETEVRGQRSEVSFGGGAVKTWVTLLVQNIGNTFLVFTLMFLSRLWFFSGRYRPEKNFLPLNPLRPITIAQTKLPSTLLLAA